MLPHDTCRISPIPSLTVLPLKPSLTLPARNRNNVMLNDPTFICVCFPSTATKWVRVWKNLNTIWRMTCGTWSVSSSLALYINLYVVCQNIYCQRACLLDIITPIQFHPYNQTPRPSTPAGTKSSVLSAMTSCTFPLVSP